MRHSVAGFGLDLAERRPTKLSEGLGSAVDELVGEVRSEALALS